jgi:hypothetical protein
MRWQTTVVALIVLLLLGGFYLYDERYLSPKREQVEQQKNRVWTGIEPKDVEEVTLTRKDDVVRLRRVADGWEIQTPLKARAAAAPVDDLVTSLVTAKMDREIASASTGLAEYGLDAPPAQVALAVKGKGEPLRLTFGGKSPTGVWVYARKPETGGVIVVSDNLFRDVTKPLGEFRDRSLLAFDRKNLTSFEIATGADTIAVEPTDGNKWKITKPVALPADTDTVADFLDKISFAKVKDFVTETPPSLEPYGLDRPVRLTLTIGKDKDRATKELLFGRADPEKKGIYAMRPGESSVLLLDESLWTQLPKNVGAIRDKTVVAFERDKLTKLELESPKGTVTLTRDGEQWKIAGPQPLAADSSTVGTLLFQIRELKAQAFLDGVKMTPTVKVSLWETGAPAPKVLTLAPSPETRGGQPSAYAAIAGQGQAVLVDAKALGELSRSANDLRDKTLFAIDTKQIGRVRIKSAEGVAVLEREGETGWKMVEPRRGAANVGKTDELVLNVRALRWADIVSPDGADAAKYGLDAPSLEVTLVKSDGAELATLLIGKREGNVAYVRSKASPVIYSVDAARLGAVPKVPADFQG